MYGHEIWGEKIKDTRIIKHVNALQRLALKTMTKHYSTTPTTALQILTGVPPLTTEVEERYDFWRECKEQIQMNKIMMSEMIHPAEKDVESLFKKQPMGGYTKIYVDASQQGEETGIGICWRGRNGELETIRKRTDQELQTHLAEQLAAREEIKEGIRKRISKIKIMTDMKGVVKSINRTNTKNKITLEIQRLITQQAKNKVYINIEWVNRRQNEMITAAHGEANKARLNQTTERIKIDHNVKLATKMGQCYNRKTIIQISE